MNKRNQPPVIAIVLLILLVCLFVFLRAFPDFSFSNISFPNFSDTFSEEDNTEENKPDMTAPIISCDINTKTIKAGDIISVSKLGIRVTDNSKIESLLFTKIRSDNFYMPPADSSSEQLDTIKKAYAEGIAISGEEFQFTYGGIYELTITATDIYANSNDFTFTLKVETPPIIETPPDYYVVTGAEIPYKDYVKVWDIVDGDYTFEDITLDTSNLNIGKEGSYTVSFSAKDKYGLTSTCTANVHIMSKKALQQLIDTHKINATDHAIVGAYNKYDIGYYDDATQLEVDIVPALVQISNSKNDVAGDGFIIKIDNEFITIATNESVVAGNLTALVSFYNEMTCSASVVFTNEEYDLAFIRIPVDGVNEASSISSDRLSTLRTVHLDEAQWKMHPVTKKVSLEQMLRHYELVFKYKLTR